jgi:CheY-like chemotaxis protein
VVYDYEGSLKRLYEDNMNLAATTLAKLEIENEKKLVQLKSDEMRILIGNVAHDLKSPLQSFVCELDTLLEYSTSAIQSSILASSSPSAPVSSTHSTARGHLNLPLSGAHSLTDGLTEESKKFLSLHGDIIDSVLLLKSICSFMAMLINRAVDFTKVSSGLQLEPRYGTVNLYEVMKWVIQCTSKSSNGIPVELKPFPTEMCDHVITDTQWFSENLLCLVSNSQKFTTEGVIAISCHLVPKNTTLSQSSSESRSFFKGSLRHAEGGLAELMIQVEVEDEGIGIPIDKREDLFEPFKQAQKRAGGIGLGLFSLSKRVERLGGACGIADRRDGKRGCRFWFTVPYRPAGEAASLDAVPEHSHVHAFPSEISQSASRVHEVISLLTNRSVRYSSGPQNRDANHSQASDDEPILPAYIRINASVKAFDRGDMCLNVDERDQPPQGGETEYTAPNLLTSEELSTTIRILRRPKMLLVEDSPLIQKTISRALIREGYEVDIAWNGAECLKMVCQTRYKVILMDIQMPVMDGVEACRRLRVMEKEREEEQVQKNRREHEDELVRMEVGSEGEGAEETWKHFIIGISADDAVRDDALGAGMDDFIPKPISMAAFKDCLARHKCQF